MTNETSTITKESGDPCQPFGALFNRLQALGLKVRRKHGSPVREIGNLGLYSVEINHGVEKAEGIHITKRVAEVLAKFFTDPKLGNIDIPFVSAIDEDAKPILEEAIKKYKGLGALIANNALHYSDNNSIVFDWFNQMLLESGNPNLIGVSRRSNLLALKADENQKYADTIIETMNKPQLIDRDVCEMAAERMLLILYTVEQRNEKKGVGNEYGDANGLLRLQAAARGYGIKLDLPQEFLKPSQALAGSTEMAHRSWTTLPTVERRGAIKRKLSAQVFKNEGNYSYTNPLNRFLEEQARRNGCFVDEASLLSQYPPPRGR